MSSSRLCVRISNCSRLFLSMCGERLTVNFSILVGSGIGPRTWAPVRLAVFTISRVDASRMRWSNALSRMRMFWPFMIIRMTDDRGLTTKYASSAWSVAYPYPSSRCRPSFRWREPRRLLDDAGDHAGTDRAATLANGEAQLLLHGDGHDELHRHGHVVPRHH